MNEEQKPSEKEKHLQAVFAEWKRRQDLHPPQAPRIGTLTVECTASYFLKLEAELSQPKPTYLERHKAALIDFLIAHLRLEKEETPPPNLNDESKEWDELIEKFEQENFKL